MLINRKARAYGEYKGAAENIAIMVLKRVGWAVALFWQRGKSGLHRARMPINPKA